MSSLNFINGKFILVLEILGKNTKICYRERKICHVHLQDGDNKFPFGVLRVRLGYIVQIKHIFGMST